MTERPRAGTTVPIPLLALFGLFLATIVYLVASSLTRRTAPVFAPSAADRVRPGGWEKSGDTLTVDATDGERWQLVSLTRGRVVLPPDSAGWELAVERYRVIASDAIADLGAIPFDSAQVVTSTSFQRTTVSGGERENPAIKHWYRYNLLTHLLEPNGHVYAIRTREGKLWKLAVVSYYCPRLTAGCLTFRYAPLL
jgi:hypothetical protein